VTLLTSAKGLRLSAGERAVELTFDVVRQALAELSGGESVPLSSDESSALFRDFTCSAFGLESLQTYTMPREQPSVAKFLAGESMPDDHNAAWHQSVRGHIEAGKTMRRVKVVRRPFSDYLRYQFAWTLPGNVAAGEDYRILD